MWQVALRYLALVATTLRPSTLTLRADSPIVFGEYNHRRPWRGRVARGKPVAASMSKRAVVDLRAFTW
ncbi:MAG TPA: hypothetical protein VF317_12755 [Dermatophilaceae bacterium]